MLAPVPVLWVRLISNYVIVTEVEAKLQIVRRLVASRAVDSAGRSGRQSGRRVVVVVVVACVVVVVVVVGRSSRSSSSSSSIVAV